MLELLMEDQIFEDAELMALFKQHDALKDQFIPIRVIKEYPHYFLCEVMPHINKYGVMSAKTYNMTINKQDLKLRNVVCRYNIA